ncbi:hypothetical protein GGX14DRAFT_345848 [Mycena pura]|uniref:Uncharacterized protein n=1 Tax=Mycena pura TaxID=153505 RepID=A0AAD7E5P6_9AGAR|nr:hypothetical protein GGX14DRAFT_345848 [Mycena pura]
MTLLIRPCRVARRVFSSLPKHTVDADFCGIPQYPTWSVNELLASYPRPALAPHTFKHLHNLSALLPPEEDTPEYVHLKTGLEELIRLVEAVKMVNTANVPTYQVEDPGAQTQEISDVHESIHGRSLLKHAVCTRNGFYIVETNKPQ